MSRIFFSCEHASNAIPAEFYNDLAIPDNIINSHRGYDIGAKEVCEHLGSEFKVNAFYGEFSRLLVDLNRSFESTNLFSQYSRGLSYPLKDKIVEKYYDPYRGKVERYTDGYYEKGEKIIHFSIHSFTPVLNAHTRFTDIGILYDPARPKEKEFAVAVQKEINELSLLQVKKNYPYVGVSDSLTTYLRKKYNPDSYIGIEIEMNQNLLAADDTRREINTALTGAIKNVLKMKLF